MVEKKGLAFAILTHKKMRLLVSVAGVAFAVLLMFVELGFINGLLDSETLLARALDADLVIMNRMKAYIYSDMPFPKKRLARALDIEGVESAKGFYMQWVRLKNTHDRKIHSIMALAFDTAVPALLIPDTRTYGNQLKYPFTALFDRTSRMETYGGLSTGMNVELETHQATFIGDFKLYPNFSTDGHILMDKDNLARLFAGGRHANILDRPQLGLIKLAPSTDLATVQKALSAHLESDVRVYTKAQVIQRIKDQWMKEQPVVQVFGLGLIVGFAIGMIICYQILFTDISDHSAEFATLKAMGYTNFHLILTVISQGVYLALLSFGPGLAASLIFYSLLQHLTGIWMAVTPVRAGAIFLLTLVMCMLSAFLAARKVIRMDPAEVFG